MSEPIVVLDLGDVLAPDELQEARNSWRKYAAGRRLCYEACVEVGFSPAQAMQITTIQSMPAQDVAAQNKVLALAERMMRAIEGESSA